MVSRVSNCSWDLLAQIPHACGHSQNSNHHETDHLVSYYTNQAVWPYIMSWLSCETRVDDCSLLEHIRVSPQSEIIRKSQHPQKLSSSHAVD